MIIETGNKTLYYRSDTKNTDYIEKYIESQEFKKFLSRLSDGVVVVLGGDGTMLGAIDELADRNLPFYGVNLGNKGFLLNDRKYLSESFIEKKYPLFEGSLEYKGEKKTLFACNEFDIRTENGRVIDLEIAFDSGLKLDLSGDGVIICTPLGSSGYNSSLGGPILPHESDLGIITAKAPWKPKRFSPFIFPLSKTIHISRVSQSGPIGIYRDGREALYIEKQQDFKFQIKKRKKDIVLLICEKYEKIWEEKIYLEQGFKK